MILGSHNVDKIEVSKMDVVRVRAKSICEYLKIMGAGGVAASDKKKITYPTCLGSNCLEVAA